MLRLSPLFPSALSETAAAGLTGLQTALLFLGVLLSAAVGYFLGSVNTGILYSKLRYRQDIRDYGSKNAGMTNMLRTYGKSAAAVTLAGDVLKAVIAVLIARVIGAYIVPGKVIVDLTSYTAAFFCVTGHCFPVYHKFRGGKGVAAAAGAMLILSPLTFLICLAVFLILVLWTKYVSLGSVIAALMYPLVLSRVGGPGVSVLFALAIGLLVVFRHKENIKRLREGKEKKISLGKKKDGPDAK
ncbi:MAG: glycerol-3-phosphate 1-O-acyltransferase PlsY [Clostridia bacterium]|nr:glycerol-3-phosphate 1-O-acyltransferase PlsY [Clostridia bacterium]